jgi:hypothetical protein
MQHDTTDSLPLATPEQEETAKRVFEGWDSMSPKEWAARYSRTIACSFFDQYRYTNPALHAWLHQLHDILRSPEKIDKL